ncbi:hypothetical protein H0H93_011436, partial [Arthromyces matolae]
TNPRNVYSNFERDMDKAQISDSSALTRRSPVDPVPIPDSVPAPPIDYSTPLKFIYSREVRQTIARREEMKDWWPFWIKDLETKVASLSASGCPPWFLDECWMQIAKEATRNKEFSAAEPHRDDSALEEMFEIHGASIERLSQKFLKRHPRSLEHSSSTRFPKSYALHQPSEKEVKLYTNARHSRIEQWNDGDQVTTLRKRMKTLPTSGFPEWLVDMYKKEISDTLRLIESFTKEEEQDGVPQERYLEMLRKHKSEIDQVDEDLKKMGQENADVHFKHLMPMIQADGGWRNHINSLIHDTSNLEKELRAASEMAHDLFLPPLAKASETQKAALKDFSEFVREHMNKAGINVNG